MSQNLPHPPAAGSLEARIAALESENQRLKAALEYSELRVEAFSMAIDYYNKQEWLYRMKRPKGTQETRELISCIVDFNNNRRPHMCIGMRTSAQMRAESLSAA